LRPCWFEPTFHKHVGKLCEGLQIHVDDPAYDHAAFRPWRLAAVPFKALRTLRPAHPLRSGFQYEHERHPPAIDVLNGGRARAARVGGRSGREGERCGGEGGSGRGGVARRAGASEAVLTTSMWKVA